MMYLIQGLEPVIGISSGTLKNPIFLRFQEPVLDETLNLKKEFQNRFLGILNFKKGSRTGSLDA
jgi:hypothetical protein